MKRSVRRYLLSFLVITGFGVHLVAAYVPTYWDDTVLDEAERHIQQRIVDEDKAYLILIEKKLEQYSEKYKESPQASYLLFELQQMVENAYDSILEAGITSTKSIYDYVQQQKAKQQSVEGHTSSKKGVVSSIVTTTGGSTEPELTLSVRDTPTKEALLSNTGMSMALGDFYAAYFPFVVTSGQQLSERCYLYYELIDEKAKEQNFPTALIIATWRKEHSCIFSNPANGWGNFQIISHYYQPGDISEQEFLEQIQKFIEFSRKKRNRYDDLQSFDALPVQLTYDTVDLTSLRKHAILYNGLYPDVTLTNSRYTNNHFTVDDEGREGIVAAFLKVLDRAVKNGKILN